MTNNSSGTATPDAPPSPGSTGAMDTLLEKLRAAAPQAKATREQRRRARLKDRHQVRVASGQKIPETGENVDESGLLSPTSENGFEDGALKEGATSEGEDIADRAATLLQGLRGDGDGDAPSRDDSLRVRRRRESADDERSRRRARRRGAGTSMDTTQRDTITDETIGNSEDVLAKDVAEPDGGEEKILHDTPTTVVVPPSPTGSIRQLD